MNPDHLQLLVCPTCRRNLRLLEPSRCQSGRIESGRLQCQGCKSAYPIKGFIPRFVDDANYADNFGLEWTKHARTQYDSYSGASVSRDRFFRETRWSERLPGQSVLEVGSGSGRFTEWAVSTGAMVVSMDYSYAVEANYAANGQASNLLIVQGDIYRMPFQQDFFHKVFCFGVLQHTPDVKRAFLVLPRYLRDGGELVVDVYRRHRGFKRWLDTKYWVRPISKHIPPQVLYRLTRSYVQTVWPLARLISRLPNGRRINRALLVVDYRGVYKLSDAILREWAILDTFDMLSPAFDLPQTIETLQQWFRETDMGDVDLCYGFNGIEARAKRQRRLARAG